MDDEVWEWGGQVYTLDTMSDEMLHDAINRIEVSGTWRREWLSTLLVERERREEQRQQPEEPRSAFQMMIDVARRRNDERQTLSLTAREARGYLLIAAKLPDREPTEAEGGYEIQICVANEEEAFYIEAEIAHVGRNRFLRAVLGAKETSDAADRFQKLILNRIMRSKNLDDVLLDYARNPGPSSYNDIASVIRRRRDRYRK